MKVHIICGGPDLWLPEKLDGLIVGVDRGALALIQAGISMSVAVGDFDSVSTDEMRQIQENTEKFVQLPPEKDVTDCEAAIELAVAEGHREIFLYGVTGGRIDHFYAVTVLMLKYIKRGISIVVEDEKNRLRVLAPTGGTIKIKDKRYFSFFALGRSVRALSIGGVKYPLSYYDLEIDDPLCVSNEAIYKRVTISFGIGYLFVIESSD